MKKTVKKCLVCAITSLLCFAFASCGGNNIPKVKPTATPDYTDADNPVLGLTLGENGKLLLDGEPVYAYGVNLFDVFVNKRILNPSFDIETPFRSLHDSGIKVVRTCMGPFYENTFARYYYSPEEYFEALDAVVAAAEKYEVGIFASVSWCINVLPDWTGEHMHEALSNREGKTIALAKKYYTDVVKRYKDSPAIWAWEFGNEYNLGADLKSMANVVGTFLPWIERSEADYYTSYDVQVFYEEVGKAIREVDPYRLIVGGDAELSSRPAALRKNDSWSPADTLEDIVDSTKLYAPDPLGGVSSHFYHSNRFGNELPDYSTDEADKTYDKWVGWGIEAARSLGKGYYVGEYGPGEALNNGLGNDDMWNECVKHLLDSFIRQDVQISLGWLCINDFRTPEKLTGFYKDWYETIVNINTDFRSHGKQDNIDRYWSKVKKTIDFDEAAHKVTNAFFCCGNPGTVLGFQDYYIDLSNGWGQSNYNTDASVDIVDETLEDGSTCKVFKLANNAENSKTMIKFDSLKGISKDKRYKLSFRLKTTGLSGDGMLVKIGSPVFFEQTGIKCDTDGTWQYFEFAVDGPSIQKSTYSFTAYFEGQKGECKLYDLKLVEVK